MTNPASHKRNRYDFGCAHSAYAARLGRPAMLLGLLACLAGCDNGPKFEYEKLRPEHVAGLSLLNVPMIHQSAPRACGAAALEMVLRYYGKNVAQEDIMKSIDRGEVGGLAAKDMKALVEHEGLHAFIIHGNAEDIPKYIDRRIPLIVARRAKFMRGLGNHFMVLVGRTSDGEFLVLNDPEKGRIRVKLERFLSDWSAAQRFMMVIGPRAEAERSRAARPANERPAPTTGPRKR